MKQDFNYTVEVMTYRIKKNVWIVLNMYVLDGEIIHNPDDPISIWIFESYNKKMLKEFPDRQIVKQLVQKGVFIYLKESKQQRFLTVKGIHVGTCCIYKNLPVTEEEKKSGELENTIAIHLQVTNPSGLKSRAIDVASSILEKIIHPILEAKKKGVKFKSVKN